MTTDEVNKIKCDAYEASVKAMTTAGKLVLDLCNRDPSGAGVQYGPVIFSAAYNFNEAVAEMLHYDNDVLFSCEPYRTERPNATVIKAATDDDIRNDMLDIMYQASIASATLLKLGINITAECAHLVNEVLDANAAYWEFEFETYEK